MKIITLLRTTMDGEPLFEDDTSPDPRDWWCVIETHEESLVHDMAIDKEGDYLVMWNEMLKYAGGPQGLKWGEDDVYGYILPDEVPPEVGEEWIDGDGDKWLRIS